MVNGRFKIPLIPPIKHTRIRYGIPLQANLLNHIQFTVLVLSLGRHSGTEAGLELACKLLLSLMFCIGTI